MGGQPSSLFPEVRADRPSKERHSESAPRRLFRKGMVSPQPQRRFGLFTYLHDDLKLNILSFVADAPLEGSCTAKDYLQSSLTHTIPLVSKKFRDFSRSDAFWKRALVRQVLNEPFLWRAGLRNMCQQDPRLTSSSSGVDLVEIAGSLLGTSYKQLYAQVLSEQVRFKGPVFFMPGQLQIGEAYGLHFFEPRYRLMIAEVMQSQDVEARRGGRIRGPALFIHANRAPLAPASQAVVVQIQQCQIHPDGRADVVLLPVSHVWLEKLWVRPNSGHLFYAQCLRMPLGLTHQMNQLARQEALAHVMDALASHISAEDALQEHNDDDDSTVGSGSSQGNASS